MAFTPEQEVRLYSLDKGDVIDHPSHYTAGKVECIDAIEAATSRLEGIQAVCTGNVIKYVWRWKRKNGVEDLRKARWYLDKLIAEASGMEATEKRERLREELEHADTINDELRFQNQLLERELAEERAAHNYHATELIEFEQENKRLKERIAELEDSQR